MDEVKDMLDEACLLAETSSLHCCKPSTFVNLHGFRFSVHPERAREREGERGFRAHNPTHPAS